MRAEQQGACLQCKFLSTCSFVSKLAVAVVKPIDKKSRQALSSVADGIDQARDGLVVLDICDPTPPVFSQQLVIHEV